MSIKEAIKEIDEAFQQPGLWLLLGIAQVILALVHIFAEEYKSAVLNMAFYALYMYWRQGTINKRKAPK